MQAHAPTRRDAASPLTPQQRAARALAHERRATLHRRALRIRRGVAGLAAAVFSAAFLAIYAELASGHDPALSSKKAVTANTQRSSSSESSATGSPSSSSSGESAAGAGTSSSSSGESATGAGTSSSSSGESASGSSGSSSSQTEEPTSSPGAVRTSQS